MTHQDYELHIGTPSVEDYRRLREIAGLSPKSQQAAEKGLPNTLYAATIRHQAGATVAMGRVVGDNGCFYQIVDIAVDPSHQGKGLGKVIVSSLIDFVNAEAPDGAYVSLIADGPARYLYAKFGFEPVMPESIGMAFRVQRS
ncbi:GNAT family N-acetyltransferase [Phyllobacterium lublinensis]|uniref:GNAT family N-acetyltransferase n=1 Tax=Phyllobacterium lublinensis TaxID=2875708 RepID=UPI001CCAE030|nr:GNAT family N-acetyltransferase [Phyllobacterium sp. 2063]MBZ9654807.1 GNAT family N-acetyltransferase [Phyllobacterium sp. 2063]